MNPVTYRAELIPHACGVAQVGELPGVELEGGVSLSMYCAFKEMPAEPHACLVAHHRKENALVLMSLRIDGQVRAKQSMLHPMPHRP